MGYEPIDRRCAQNCAHSDLRLRELLLHPELFSECPILSKKLHPEWTKIRGSGQEMSLILISKKKSKKYMFLPNRGLLGELKMKIISQLQFDLSR